VKQSKKKALLPNLEKYKQQFLDLGVTIPLPVVPVSSQGLLRQLPPYNLDKNGWPWTEETDPVLYQSKQHWPKITIVTPSYNQGIFLEETIRSVLLQNYPNLEYILLDAGSSDRSVEIIKKYEPWLSYWISKKDRGQSHAINQGLALATGEFWQWINSDDRYFSDAFYQVASHLIETQKDTLYASVFESTDDKSLQYSRKSFNINKTVILNPNSEFNKDFYYKPEATIMNVKLSKKVKGLREDLHNLFDTEFILNYSEECDPTYIDLPIIHYRIHSETKTISMSRNMFQEYFLILKENHKILSKRWWETINKEIGFSCTSQQSGKSHYQLIKLSFKLVLQSPLVLTNRAYWGLIRKIVSHRK
jgi:glycosyltransferase involved in cell wall biosynthesis